MAIDHAQLKTEIQSDPEKLGYDLAQPGRTMQLLNDKRFNGIRSFSLPEVFDVMAVNGTLGKVDLARSSVDTDVRSAALWLFQNMTSLQEPARLTHSNGVFFNIMRALVQGGILTQAEVQAMRGPFATKLSRVEILFGEGQVVDRPDYHRALVE